MAKAPIKTLKELSIVNKDIDTSKLELSFIQGKTAELEKQLKIVTKLKKNDADRQKLLDEMLKLAEETNKKLKDVSGKDSKEILDSIAKIQKEKDKIATQDKNWEGRLKEVNKLFAEIVKHNQEIYKTSHAMQTESNITWKQFRELYDGAYASAKQMNAELGKQIFNSAELIKTQEKMTSTGWKGLSTANLTNMTGAMALLQRTLGDLDARLVNAFQISYNQFGNMTDQFVTKMGNNLNAFSGSFGLTTAALQGAVADMLEVNTFIARNNLEAQIQANTSFMQAAALSSGLNMQNLSFISQLARTSEFGTAGEIANLYSAGAYLTGFDAGMFMEGMSGGDAYGATRNLISSIQTTLGGMEDNKLLRNEFMREIQQGFGISQGDILAILNAEGNMAEIEQEIQNKLLNSSNSMVDELKDLKVSLVDQLENFWANSNTSKYLGKIMNELGLYDVNKLLTTIASLIGIQTMTQLKQAIAGGGGLNLGNMLGGIGKTGAATAGKSIAGTAGMFGGGMLLSSLSSHIGGNMQANQNSQAANIVGGTVNVLGNAGGGALMGAAIGSVIPVIGTAAGAAIGGIIGGIKGIVETSGNAQARKTALEELDAKERLERRQAQAAPTGDPVIDTLNSGFSSVVNAITGEGAANRELTLTVDLAKTSSSRTSVLGT